MPKKNTVEVLPPNTEPEIAEVRLAVSTLPIAEQVEKTPGLVPTKKLVPFYSTAKAIEKRIVALKAIAKKELLNRLNEATPYGDQNQHREFSFDGYRVKAEQRVKRTLKVDEAIELVKSRKLGSVPYDLIIESGAEDLQAFLKKHRKEVAAMGLVVREEINIDKFQEMLAANVTLKKITVEEFESLIDVGDPTYNMKD